MPQDVVVSTTDMADGVVLTDKPKGITSFDVIRVLRRRMGPAKKIGHAGTLDPNATGLLIIGVGEGTKRLHEIAGLPKTYVMEILLGIRTDTGDIEGMIVEQGSAGDITTDAVENILKEMIGAIALPIPAYSALKVRGKPRYDYARKGIAIEPKIRTMEIRALTLLGVVAEKGARPALKVEMDCASGTYARSVAEEIGRRLWVPATVRELRRTRIGAYRVEDAEHLTNEEKKAMMERLRQRRAGAGTTRASLWPVPAHPS